MRPKWIPVLIAAAMAVVAWRAKTPRSSMSRSEKVGDECLSSTWSTPWVPWSSSSGAAAMARNRHPR